MQVVKRDGTVVEFDGSKIVNAICKAMLEVGDVNVQVATDIATRIAAHYASCDSVDVETIQDRVEEELMTYRPNIAKRYILYREKHAEQRAKGWQLTDIQRDIWNNKYRFENESFDTWVERVSGGNPRIAKRIRKKQFLFAGRILYGRGLNQHGIKATLSNCYVLPPPTDSIAGIWDTARDMAITYSVGGGCGTSLRYLRPRGAQVHNAARSTSGAPSFMDLYSLTTELIGQEGRRGALMLSIPSSHPDLAEFIDVKRDLKRVTKANISVEWSNDFMIAVEDKKPYTLRFVVEDTGEVMEKEVDAYQLFRRAAENNWLMAEPGCLFWDRIRTWNLMSHDPEFSYAGVNPCAEEPLPPGGSCLLGSLNWEQFVVAPFTKYARFDYPAYIEAVADAVEGLNEVLDEGLPLHPLAIQRETVAKYRQIGLGVMGVHEALIKLGLVYGSTKSMAFVETVMHLMLVEAVRKSALLAKEHGAFPAYQWENVKESWFFQELIPPDVKALVKAYGLRNSQLLSIAPTGSISTMLGISGGMEPLFALEYTRKTQTLHQEETTYTIKVDIVREYLDFHGLPDDAKLPDVFVTAHQLDWRNRVEMQAVFQRYVDASISSTINLPNETTVDEIVELYLYAWKMGLKGCTIYRDGCARTGILTVESKEDEHGRRDDHVSASAEGSRRSTSCTEGIRDGRNTGGSPCDAVTDLDRGRVDGYFATCPSCGSDTERSNGCVSCPVCGWSACS